MNLGTMNNILSTMYKWLMMAEDSCHLEPVLFALSARSCYFSKLFVPSIITAIFN